jgi:cytochrome oxidase Cu insertion factor (SCO1/SenC/PrrC family)
LKRLLWWLVFSALAASGSGDVVDLQPQRGRSITPIKWFDETGKSRSLADLSGYPLIILPIYTRCRGACVQNVDRLKTALVESSVDVNQFRVLLFSFDAADSPAVLAKYRSRENIPLAWAIGSAPQPEIDALLDSIGIQVGKAGPEFTHPNILIFVDSRLRIAKWIYGTDYAKGDVELALGVANGRSDWLGRHSDAAYALLLFSVSILCVVLVYSIRQYKLRARHPAVV